MLHNVYLALHNIIPEIDPKRQRNRQFQLPIKNNSIFTVWRFAWPSPKLGMCNHGRQLGHSESLSGAHGVILPRYRPVTPTAFWVFAAFFCGELQKLPRLEGRKRRENGETVGFSPNSLADHYGWYGVLVCIVEYSLVVVSIFSFRTMGHWENWDSYTVATFCLICNIVSAVG